ncbi:hypothetical protein F53441_7757 [Fusarium austroafricanum]|uniref:Uncharacterized protein n=1 Tax=Fusarium austroafricanum TaxID=2364996 RepID=A0A8H4KEU4_9HYPO|nr:hypothetical protein F53441_7757 [Fusarium austroafricanum]
MSGATVTLNTPQDGDIMYTVQQNEFKEAEYGGEGNKTIFDWSFGPVMNQGCIDLNTYEIKITPTYNGIQAGTLDGSLKDGMGINLDLFTAKGSQRWYLKNGNEIWTNLDIKIVFDGSFQGDYKIMSF